MKHPDNVLRAPDTVAKLYLDLRGLGQKDINP
jgi:hypothetical protein